MGFATHYADKIDWDVLRKKYPFVINTIRMLDLLVPLSGEVRHTVGLGKAKIGRDVGVDYKGWPNTSFPATRTGENSLTALFFDSISAPEWWLRLHYGYKDIFPIWFCRYIRHPLRLFKMASQWFFYELTRLFAASKH